MNEYLLLLIDHLPECHCSFLIQLFIKLIDIWSLLSITFQFNTDFLPLIDLTLLSNDYLTFLSFLTFIVHHFPFDFIHTLSIFFPIGLWLRLTLRLVMALCLCLCLYFSLLLLLLLLLMVILTAFMLLSWLALWSDIPLQYIFPKIHSAIRISPDLSIEERIIIIFQNLLMQYIPLFLIQMILV